ncbi:MAG TPA: hypothetical protein VLA74_11330, partial [Nitrososphaeraceae archaeon]|nr:hypothetical protein [Nitrososphaeraceae archaeon]
HIVTNMDTKFVKLTKNNYIYAVQVDFQNDMNATYKYKGIKLYAFIDGSSHLISFNGLESDYYEYLPLIHQVLNSFEFKNYKKDQFVTYENPYAKIKFQYPANWHIDTYSTNLPRFTFPEDVSFPEDELPVLEKDRNKEEKEAINSLSYGMYIDVASTFDSGADYVIEVNREPEQYNWSKLVKELSPENKMKTNEESNFTKFIDKNNKDHISFSVELEKINSPKDFSIMFYAVEYGDNDCHFIDVTNFLPIPLPDVEMKVDPNKPITITRGKEAIVELHIKSDSSINSHVLVSSSKNEENKDIKTNILPNSTIIPPKDTAISILKIKL